jgi:hypothetical protein
MKTQAKTALELLTALLVTASLFAAPPPREIQPAFGPHVNLTTKDFAESKSFAAADRIVGTYYFYWYDVYSKGHIIDGDGTDALTDHPASLEDFSYTSVRWHKKELSDMIAAGIDVVLPVFWGAPSEQATNAGLQWSYAGLPPLVQAREELLREGKAPPRIGLFYDTSTLQYNQWHQHIDLTTDYGKRWFYATVRDFFSMIPPKHWAMIDGKSIVLLYAAAFAKNHDQGFIDYTRQQFARDFGGRLPYIGAEVSWRVKADNKVAWGGALGLRNPGIAALGPGYDHSAVPGRTPLIVDRLGGKFYETNWIKFLRRPSNFVMLETWNEFHEGTDVCESKEFGRQYLDLTRKYADLFKRGWAPPWPAGKYSAAQAVSITLGNQDQSDGLVRIGNDDGVTVPAVAGARACRALQTGVRKHGYVYFIADDSFKRATRNLKLEMEYFDAAPGTLGVEFDGSDPEAPFNGAYTPSRQTVKLAGSKTWKTAEFQLTQARLLNSQNRNADLRLVVNAPEFQVARVTLKAQ